MHLCHLEKQRNAISVEEYSPSHTCPSKGKICAKCKKPNILAHVCKSNKSVNAVIEYKESPADNSNKDEDVFLYATENNTNKSRDEALITLEVNHSLPVKFKVDTGAQANILPAKYFDTLPHPPSLKQRSQKLTSYCGSKIPVRGVCELSCKHKSSKAETLPFFIVETDSVPILRFRSSIDLNIVKLVLNVSKLRKGHACNRQDKNG